MLDYAWICLNMPKYVGICVNMSKYAWVAFVIHVPILIPCLLERVVTYFNEIYSLKENEVVFLNRQYFIFSVVAGNIWFIFCFRLNIFTGRISNLLLPFGAEGTGDRKCWYTFAFPFSSLRYERFFFYQSFLSRTLATHRTAGESRGPSFHSTLPIPPAHEHSDICLQLCTWDDYHIFNLNGCIYQAATRWDLPPYRISIWLIDDVILIFVYLLVDLILGFVKAISYEEPVDLSSHWLSTLYYKRTE